MEQSKKETLCHCIFWCRLLYFHLDAECTVMCNGSRASVEGGGSLTPDATFCFTQQINIKKITTTA